jgi:MtrB/PioB family decaheme-associated outer membrane protein
MKATFKRFTSLPALVLLTLPLALLSTAWAQDEADGKDSKDKDGKDKAKSESVVENEVELGFYYLDDDSFRYGKYSGLTDEGLYALADFRLEKRPEWNSGDATRWRFQGWRLGLDSRRLEFDWHQQGRQRFSAEYRQIPNNGFRDGMTPYLGLGTGTLDLPSDWEINRYSDTTRGFLNLEESLRPFRVDTERKTMTLEYQLKLSQSWEMSISYKHDNKDGVRTTAGVFGWHGGNARSVIIPAPVDWQTDNFNAMFEYSAGRFRFGAGIYASFFDNGEESLQWQNAYGQPGTWDGVVAYPNGYGQMALEPDNSYLQFKTYAGINITGRTRLMADLSYGKMEQDDAFLPYTINPTLDAPLPLPMDNADAQINMTMINLRLTSQLARRLNLTVNYRYDDRNNKTPRAAYAFISADSQDQRDLNAARINLPYSYTEHEVDATLNWRVARGVNLKGGVVWNDYQRDYSEVKDSDEFTYLAGIRFSRWQKGSLSLDYRNAERDIDEYVGNAPFQASHLPGTVAPDAWENHPWLRKYNQTDRERSEWRFRGDWFPVPEFNLGLTAQSLEDEYTDNAFGLNEAESGSWTIDAGYYPTEKVVLSAYYTKEEWESEMSGRAFFSHATQPWDPERDWWGETEDSADTWNIHLGLNDLGESEMFSFGLDFTRSNVESLIDVRGAAEIETQALPELKNKLSTFTVYGDFVVGKRSTVTLRAERGKLDVDDFSLDNVEADTMTTVLSLGQATADYDILLISASWRYRF